MNVKSTTLYNLLLCRRPRPFGGRSHTVIDVLTRDDELFPVKRKLLRPCINLTQAVRSDVPSVTINVDTLVFDRYNSLTGYLH